MPERSMFFRETDYNAEDFAGYFRQFLSNGVYKKDHIENLKVISNGVDMTITISLGTAFIHGYLYEVFSEPVTLTHDPAEPNFDRIDTVVLQWDRTEGGQYIKAFIKKGMPSADPQPPILQQDEFINPLDNFIYELPLANIRIVAGKSFIELSQITDRREYVDILETMYVNKSEFQVHKDNNEIHVTKALRAGVNFGIQAHDPPFKTINVVEENRAYTTTSTSSQDFGFYTVRKTARYLKLLVGVYSGSASWGAGLRVSDLQRNSLAYRTTSSTDNNRTETITIDLGATDGAFFSFYLAINSAGGGTKGYARLLYAWMED